MMSQTDIIYSKGVQALVDALGIVGMETFISFVKTDDFDYTEWRKDYFKDVTMDDIDREAAILEKTSLFATNAKRI